MFGVGDLVVRQNYNREIGIILWQVGCVDRWVVYWFDEKYKQGYNGCNLELL